MLVDKRFRLGQLDEVLGEENRFRMFVRNKAHGLLMVWRWQTKGSEAQVSS